MTALNFTKGKGIVHYLGTESGSYVLRLASGAVGCAVGCAVMIPQVFTINWIKRTLQMYRDGYPVKMAPNVIELASQVLADTKVQPAEAKRIRWFTAFGFDPIAKGQTIFRNGGIIGLPLTFSYTGPDDVDRSLIKLHADASVPWRSEAGQALLTALVFSEDARKAAIAMQLELVQSQHVVVKTVGVGMVIPTVASLTAHFNERYNVSRYPLRGRLTWYAVTAAMALALTLYTFDQLHRYYEAAVDEAVARLGENYVAGAVEYLGKRMLANRALRELLGEQQGPRVYTAEGNVRHGLWEPHVPLGQRKAFFEAHLQRLRAGNAEKENEEKKNVAA